MRGMGGIALAVVLGVVIYLYFKQTGGAPSGIGGAVDTNAVGGKAKGAWDDFYAQPWFWTFAVSGVLAVVGVMTWRRIGGWGRAVVLVLAAIAATVLVTR